MATEDGYYLGRKFAGMDISDQAAAAKALLEFETPRRPHTARQSQTACFLGQVIHHSPRPLAPARDTVFDHTPFLQTVIGESAPGEILKQLDEIEEAETCSRQTLA